MRFSVRNGTALGQSIEELAKLRDEMAAPKKRPVSPDNAALPKDNAGVGVRTDPLVYATLSQASVVDPPTPTLNIRRLFNGHTVVCCNQRTSVFASVGGVSRPPF
jgi:hypothetical protein